MDQRTNEWDQARLGKVTASMVFAVMAKTKSGPSASRKNYRADLLVERLTGQKKEGFTSEAMLWGTNNEPMARGAYEAKNGIMVEEVGFVKHPTIEGFGASPDGLVGDDGLVEIKCPNTATHLETMADGEIDGKYQWQMLAQMACTGRKWCDFVSYDQRLPEGLNFVVIRFERDQKAIDEMENEIILFLAELAEMEATLKGRISF